MRAVVLTATVLVSESLVAQDKVRSVEEFLFAMPMPSENARAEQWP